MRRLSPVSVSEARANGVPWLTGYAATVRGWLAILVVVAWLVGCRNRDIERLTEIKDQVCACKTVSCAEEQIKAVPKSAIKSTHRTQAIARDMLGCLARLHEAERPITDPDAESDPELDPESEGDPEGEPGNETESETAPRGEAPPRSGAATAPRTSAPASARTR
jgi:hypothetical protein